jgi:hypothetical protein
MVRQCRTASELCSVSLVIESSVQVGRGMASPSGFG